MLDRVQRACDKLGRGDKLTKALRDTLTEIQYDLELEGKLTTWASWWLNARKRQQLLRVDDTLRARRVACAGGLGGTTWGGQRTTSASKQPNLARTSSSTMPTWTSGGAR